MLSIIKHPSTETKLNILTQSAQYDVCLAGCSLNPSGKRGRMRDPKTPNRWVYPDNQPDRGSVGIMKVLQTNVCSRRCTYCPFSADKDNSPRAALSPQELADTFMNYLRKRLVHGIFISSGTSLKTETAMEKMILTAAILRNYYKFRGYIHLKILPGTSFELIEKAAKLADRISINLEAPTREHLKKIAPDKNLVDDLVKPMKLAGNIIKGGAYAKSQTTQFIVGASNETDIDLLKAVDWIYREMFVYRAYFSAYQKLNSPDQKVDNTNPLLREHRLYQSDYLLRGYGFRFEDLVFDESGNIPLDVDPKTAYAMLHPELYPVDINSADETLLLKVPGIGPISARRIIERRTKNPFKNIADLKGTGTIAKWASPYITFSGKNSSGVNDIQEWLFKSSIDKSWKTGVEPFEKDKINPVNQENNKKTAYEYPGQKGRPLQRPTSKNEQIFCR